MIDAIDHNRITRVEPVAQDDVEVHAIGAMDSGLRVSGKGDEIPSLRSKSSCATKGLCSTTCATAPAR